MDYLESYGKEIQVQLILMERNLRFTKAQEKNWDRYRQALEVLPQFKSNLVKLNQDVITVGNPAELDTTQTIDIKNALKTFIPWKKGPWEIFGEKIDSEWKCELKWQRLQRFYSSLRGKKIADIGCNNGYYLFRMASESPKLVIGFEPFIPHWYNFQLIQRYVQSPLIHFEMLGVEHIHFYPKFFDYTFCLGILYHHTDPVTLLKKMYESLKVGGSIFIDWQGYESEEATLLIPEERYAGSMGVWNVPTKKAIFNYLKRTNFREIECIYEEPLSSEEQRTTDWAPIKSLKDFLDPTDLKKTVEGYPAPWRFYFHAKK